MFGTADFGTRGFVSEDRGESFPGKDSFAIFIPSRDIAVGLFHVFFLNSRQAFAIMVLPGERLSAVVGHLNPTKATGRASLLKKNPDDIVNIPRTSGLRT